MSCSNSILATNSKNELIGNNQLINNGSSVINCLQQDIIRLIASFFIEKPEDVVRLGLVSRHFSFLTLDVHLCSFALKKFFPFAIPKFYNDSPLLYKQIVTKNFNIKKGHFRLQTPPFQMPGSTDMMMPIHNGKLISSDCVTGEIKIRDLHSGQELKTLSGYQFRVACLATYNDMLIFGSLSSRDIKIWDLHSGQELKTLSGHRFGVTCLTIYNDMLISGGYDHDIKIWDLDSGQELKTLSGHQDHILCLAIYNDMLISGGYDHDIKIWDLDSGQELQTLSGHQLGVTCLTTYNHMLISGSYDGDIKIWDLLSGQELKTLSGYQFGDGVSCLTIYNDMLISGSYDRDIKIWDLYSGQELNTLRHPFKVSCLSVCGSKLFYGFFSSRERSFGILDFDFPSLSPYSKQVLQDNLFILEKMLWAPYHGQPIEVLAKMLHPDFQERLRQHCYKLGVPFPHCSIPAILRVKTEVCLWALLDAIHDKDQKRVSGLLNQLIHINPQNTKIYELLWEICKGPEMCRWGEYAFHNQRGCSASLLQKEQAVVQFKDILKKKWGEDLPLLLADFGIVTQQEYSQKLGCTPGHLSKIGICSRDDLDALFNFNSPSFQYLKVEEAIHTTVNPQTIALNEKKIFVALLDQLSAAAQKKSDEIKRFSVHRDNDGNVYNVEIPNPWDAFQDKLKRIKEILNEQTVGPRMLSEKFIPSYLKHVQELNALIDEFRALEQEPEIQFLKLYNYVNQWGILAKWNALKQGGIGSLSALQQQKDIAPLDIFAMGK